MSLFNALNTGITGLGTNGLSLSVIGDNISNLNTVGYKGSSAEFQDLILQQLGGGRGQLGQGAFTGKVGQIFGQGGIENTASSSDMAIDGKGLFVLSDAEGNRFFSRAGQFRLDTAGNLVNLVGMKLQGFGADAAGNLTTSVGDIVIPTDPIAGAATGEVTVTANLDVQTAFVAAPASPPTQADLDAATFTSSTVVYDSLGTAHDVTLAYWATAAGTWSFSAVVDATETGGPAGTFTELASGSLVFDTSGNLDTAASSVTSNPVTFTGAAAQTVAFDFGLATGDEGALTQYDTPTSNVYDVSADGNASGDLGSFDIAADGTVTGVYSNGVTRTLGQVVLAQFRAETGLNRVGHNLYQQSLGSGEPVIGAANAGGRGVVHSYALEMSNVDMEQQFVKMIQSQKGYQASARVVSAVDDMLKELMQVV